VAKGKPWSQVFSGQKDKPWRQLEVFMWQKEKMESGRSFCGKREGKWAFTVAKRETMESRTYVEVSCGKREKS
jgi:hypothetical protein